MLKSFFGFPFASIIFLICISACKDKGHQVDPPADAAQDSIGRIKAALSQDSLNPKTWEQYYHLLMNAGDTVSARNAIEHYTALVPEDVNGWIELGFILASQKDPLVLALTDTLYIKGDDATKSRASYIKGIYHSNMKAWDEAIRDYDTAILLNYSFIDPYIDKGILLYDQKKYDEALKSFQLAFTLDKHQPELYYWISKAFEALGEKAAAVDWMKKYEALK